MNRKFIGKRILVTGVCGTVGCELIRQLLEDLNDPVEAIIGVDNNESAIFFIDQKYNSDPRAHFFVLDVRDREELIAKTRGVDIIFHCAAMKHVTISERSPDQAVSTNIIGVQNIINAAEVNNVEVVVFTSSDKAVNPTNVMGTTKLMGERLMTAASENSSKQGTCFVSTRFGNVLGSNGSVVPIFKHQIKNGGPVTLTDRMMTRFVMSAAQAAILVIDSARIGVGGEVFVTKMPVISIADLAQALIELMRPMDGLNEQSVEIRCIGSKPGEKLYEELMSEEETQRAVELSEYYSILPAFHRANNEPMYIYDSVEANYGCNAYKSINEPRLSVEEIKKLLISYDLC